MFQRSPKTLLVKATSVKMITWMAGEELEDIMDPVEDIMTLEVFHVVILKGVDLLPYHMREDAWNTTLHLLVAGIGVMTGGKCTPDHLLNTSIRISDKRHC
jgi:hypothetical protein